MDQEVPRVASTTPDGTLHYNRRWGEFAAFGSIMVLAAGITAGITLRARTNVADEEKDMQAAVPQDTTPLPVAAEIKMMPPRCAHFIQSHKIQRPYRFLPRSKRCQGVYPLRVKPSRCAHFIQSRKIQRPYRLLLRSK